MIKASGDNAGNPQLSLFDEVFQEMAKPIGQSKEKRTTLSSMLGMNTVLKLVNAIERRYREMDSLTQTSELKFEEDFYDGKGDVKKVARNAWAVGGVSPSYEMGYGVVRDLSGWVGEKKIPPHFFDLGRDRLFWEEHLGTGLLKKIEGLSEKLWDNAEDWAYFWLGGLDGTNISGTADLEEDEFESGAFATMEGTTDELGYEISVEPIVSEIDQRGAALSVHTLLMGFVEGAKLKQCEQEGSGNDRAVALLSELAKMPQKDEKLTSLSDFWFTASAMNLDKWAEHFPLMQSGEEHSNETHLKISYPKWTWHKKGMTTMCGHVVHSERYNRFLRAVMSHDNTVFLEGLSVVDFPLLANVLYRQDIGVRVPSLRLVDFLMLCEESEGLSALVSKISMEKIDAAMDVWRSTGRQPSATALGGLVYLERSGKTNVTSIWRELSGNDRDLSHNDMKRLSDFYRYMVKSVTELEADKHPDAWVDGGWIRETVHPSKKTNVGNLLLSIGGREMPSENSSEKDIRKSELADAIRMELYATRLRLVSDMRSWSCPPKKSKNSKLLKQVKDAVRSVVGDVFFCLGCEIRKTKQKEYDMDNAMDVAELKNIETVLERVVRPSFEVLGEALKAQGVSAQEAWRLVNIAEAGGFAKIPTRVSATFGKSLSPLSLLADSYPSETESYKKTETLLNEWAFAHSDTYLGGRLTHNERHSVGKRNSREQTVFREASRYRLDCLNILMQEGIDLVQDRDFLDDVNGFLERNAENKTLDASSSYFIASYFSGHALRSAVEAVNEERRGLGFDEYDDFATF